MYICTGCQQIQDSEIFEYLKHPVQILDVKKFKIVKVLVCLSKDLKRSFLSSHINPFKQLHSCFLVFVCLFVRLICFCFFFCFVFFVKYLIIYFTYSVAETYCLSYIGSQEAYSP